MTAQAVPEVVVIGAGVIGLSTAVCLAERGGRVELRTELEPAQTTSAMIGPAMAPRASQVGRWEQTSTAQFWVGLRAPATPRPSMDAEQIGAARCVHSYGHGGSGVTNSWGAALDATKLLLDEKGHRASW